MVWVIYALYLNVPANAHIWISHLSSNTFCKLSPTHVRACVPACVPVCLPARPACMPPSGPTTRPSACNKRACLLSGPDTNTCLAANLPEALQPSRPPTHLVLRDFSWTQHERIHAASPAGTIIHHFYVAEPTIAPFVLSALSSTQPTLLKPGRKQ